MPLPKSLYEQVRQRANFRCEYCHYPEQLSSAPLSIDHILNLVGSGCLVVFIHLEMTQLDSQVFREGVPRSITRLNRNLPIKRFA